MNSDHGGYDYSFAGFNDYTSQMNESSSVRENTKTATTAF